MQEKEKNPETDFPLSSLFYLLTDDYFQTKTFSNKQF